MKKKQTFVLVLVQILVLLVLMFISMQLNGLANLVGHWGLKIDTDVTQKYKTPSWP